MNIENYEIKASAVQDEVLLVVSRICLNFAKDTTRGGFGSDSGGNVLTSPWAPQPINSSYLKLAERLKDRGLARFIRSRQGTFRGSSSGGNVNVD